MNRREALAVLGAAGLPGVLSGGPASPQLCLFSKVLAKVGYSELGEIVKQFGFDGIDLTIRPGGHVEPRLSSVDLVRAFESVTGAGLECPLITTALTSPLEPSALAVLAISGRSGIPLFRPGDWQPVTSGYRRNIAGLLQLGSRYGIAMALHNYTAENSGMADWDLPETLALLDPKWAGAYFDPIHHGQAWEAALTPLLPRLRAVALKDFTAKGVPCPLGEGIVDWTRFFQLLTGFSGVLSLRIEYAPKDEVGAIVKDYAFARARMKPLLRSEPGSGS